MRQYRDLFLTLAFVLASALAAHGDDLATEELLGRAIANYHAGRSVEAHRQLTSIIGFGTRDARVFYFRGLCCLRLGRQPDADADWQQGAALERRDLEQVTQISRSLERVQGDARRRVENYRIEARLAVLRRAEAYRVAARPMVPTPKPAAAAEAPAGADATAGGAMPANAPMRRRQQRLTRLAPHRPRCLRRPRQPPRRQRPPQPRLLRRRLRQRRSTTRLRKEWANCILRPYLVSNRNCSGRLCRRAISKTSATC